MAAQDPRNVIEGAVRVFIGKSALEASPDVVPLATVAFGGTWGATWRELGFTTEDGITFGGLTADMNPVQSGQQRAAITHMQGTVAETLAFTLLEATLENLRDMSGRGALVVGTQGASAVYSTLEWNSGAVKYYALGAEGFGPNGVARRFIFPIVTMSISGDVNYRQGQPMGIPVTASRSGGTNGNPKWYDVVPPTS